MYCELRSEITKDLLTLLQEDARQSIEKLATLTGLSCAEVAELKQNYEDEGTILGYQAVVNWEHCQKISALIEVKITPQGSDGFDRIARRIGQYHEVESVFLMSSGTHDLTVSISGEDLQSVGRFVSDHLATIPGVTSTATHFVLKKYKDSHFQMSIPEPQERARFLL